MLHCIIEQSDYLGSRHWPYPIPENWSFRSLPYLLTSCTWSPSYVCRLSNTLRVNPSRNLLDHTCHSRAMGEIHQPILPSALVDCFMSQQVL